MDKGRRNLREVATEKGRRNFIDFILEAQKNKELVVRFLLLTEPQDLKKFFYDEGFRDISDDDIGKIIEARKSFADKMNVRLGDDYY